MWIDLVHNLIADIKKLFQNWKLIQSPTLSSMCQQLTFEGNVGPQEK